MAQSSDETKDTATTAGTAGVDNNNGNLTKTDNNNNNNNNNSNSGGLRGLHGNNSNHNSENEENDLEEGSSGVLRMSEHGIIALDSEDNISRGKSLQNAANFWLSKGWGPSDSPNARICYKEMCDSIKDMSGPPPKKKRRKARNSNNSSLVCFDIFYISFCVMRILQFNCFLLNCNLLICEFILFLRNLFF